MSRLYPLVIAVFLLVSSSSVNAATAVRPDPGQRYQVIEGWGLSLCWWAHMMGQWKDEAKIDEAIELLTSPDQLNMNIFRYNIGGGDDPSHYSKLGQPGHMAHGKGVRAEMEGFKPTENGPYDPNADAGQRKVLLKILESRSDVILEAFSNSPPYWMTHSGCSAGNFDAGEDNLKPEYYSAFCDYLIDVCLHYKAAHGVEFRTLEPFNESTSKFWGYMGSQEGCHFDVETQLEIIRRLESKLKKTSLKTVLSASDETNVKAGIQVLKVYMSERDIVSRLGQYNVHTYSVSPEQRKELKRLTDQTGLRFWQSESGPMGIKRKDPYAVNLAMARRMFDDLRDMQPVAWLDWQFMEENNSTWCFIRGDFADEDFRIVKNFYVRMQVTRFVKQGYQIIESGDPRVLAAVSPSSQELVLVVLNATEVEEVFDLDLSAFDASGMTARVFRTSRTEDCERLSGIEVKRQLIGYAAPAESITSLVLSLVAE